MGFADLFALCAIGFTGRFLPALDQPAIRSKLLNTGETICVGYYVKNGHRQDITNTRHSFQQMKLFAMTGLCLFFEFSLHLAQLFIEKGNQIQV